MKKENYLLLKEQLEIIDEIENAYMPGLSRGEDPIIDDRNYMEAVFEQAGILVIMLEEVLKDEQDRLE